VKLGSATFVNAMQGVQFVFLLGLVVLLSKKFPAILEEELTREVLLQKILAIGLIICGLFALYI